MGSRELVTKESQKSKFSGQVDERISMLKEKGLDEKQIAKDDKVKRFKAKIKQVNAAIARIGFLDDQKKRLAEKKEQRKAEMAAAKLEAMTSDKKVRKGKVEEAKPAPGGKKAGAKAKAGGGDKKDAKKKGK
jgi:hypothetical protein